MSESIKASNEPVAGNIRRIIDERRLNRPLIAKTAGMRPRELTDVLNGAKVVRASEIEAIAEAMSVDVCELFDRQEDETRYIL